jgi:hypothetical protein
MQITITQFQGGQNASDGEPSLVDTSNYLYALCAPYNLKAAYIINTNLPTVVVTPSGVSGIITPIRVIETDFIDATHWAGANSVNQAILPNYRLQVFANFVARYLLQGTEWVRTAAGIQIIMPGFDATVNQYEFYIDISLY